MAVHKPSLAVTTTVYVVIVVGLASTLAPVVEFKPVEGVHVYVNVPLLLEGIAERLADAPLQMVWSAIAFNTTLGELTVTTGELVAVAVQEPSVAVTVTV